MARKRKNRNKVTAEDCGITKGGSKRASRRALINSWKGEKRRQLWGFWKP